MTCVFEFAQVAEGCDLAAEQILRDFVVNGAEIDLFDGYAVVGLTVMES